MTSPSDIEHGIANGFYETNWERFVQDAEKATGMSAEHIPQVARDALMNIAVKGRESDGLLEIWWFYCDLVEELLVSWDGLKNK